MGVHPPGCSWLRPFLTHSLSLVRMTRWDSCPLHQSRASSQDSAPLLKKKQLFPNGSQFRGQQPSEALPDTHDTSVTKQQVSVCVCVFGGYHC